MPTPPNPLGAYVESSITGSLLFLSGILPVVSRKLAIAGRLGDNLSVKEGQEAARIASLNALAVAKQHLEDLDRLKKLVKLTVLIATTEQFTEHAAVADRASDLFVQIFGTETVHGIGVRPANLQNAKQLLQIDDYDFVNHANTFAGNVNVQAEIFCVQLAVVPHWAF